MLEIAGEDRQLLLVVTAICLIRQRIANDCDPLDVRNERSCGNEGVAQRQPDRCSGHIRDLTEARRRFLIDHREDDRNRRQIGPQALGKLQGVLTDGNDDSDRFVAILLVDEDLQELFVFRAFEMAVLQLLRVDGNRRSGAGVQAGLEGCHQLGEPGIIWNGLIENQNRARQRLGSRRNGRREARHDRNDDWPEPVQCASPSQILGTPNPRL